MNSLRAFLLISTLGFSACFSPGKLAFNDYKAAVEAGRAPASGEEYAVELPITKRSYVESVFIQVFNIPVGDPDLATLKTAIYDKKEFGGSCDRYGVSDITVNGVVQDEFPRARCGSGITMNLDVNSNPMRYAWTIKACETMIISKAARFAAAMNRIFPGWTAGSSNVAYRPNAENVKKSYDLFFQGREPDAEVIQELVTLGNSAATNDAGWQLILIAECGNPEWQSL